MATKVTGERIVQAVIIITGLMGVVALLDASDIIKDDANNKKIPDLDALGDDDILIYQPKDGRSIERWLETAGMPEETFRRVASKVRRIKGLNHTITDEAKLTVSDVLFGGTILSEKQLDLLDFDDGIHRHKRAAINYTGYPDFRWPSTTIKYKFNGAQKSDDKKMILEAMNQWSKATCFRFVQGTDPIRYIFFTTASTGCWSYTGRAPVSMIPAGPQPVNLQHVKCNAWLGQPVHELGHVLGLTHTHQRPDRDLYLDIYLQNVINEAMQRQFLPFRQLDIETFGYPLDAGSVMAYGSADMSKDNKRYQTCVHKERRLTNALGQRVTLSFADARFVNSEYCSDICPTSLNCTNGGYTDPNDCSKCRCPEGLGGTLCDKARPSNGGCSPVSSAEYFLSDSQEICVSSRRFESKGTYNIGDTCNYLIQAPLGCTITATFDHSRFGTYCYKPGAFPACYQWVEVKHLADLSQTGPRFCCKNGKHGPITSETNHMVLSFDARAPIRHHPSAAYPGTNWRLGFKTCFRISDLTCLPTTSPPSTTAAATTTTNATTLQPPTTAARTTSQATTTPATTTTPRWPEVSGCRFVTGRLRNSRPCPPGQAADTHARYQCCNYKNQDGRQYQQCHQKPVNCIDKK